MTMLLVQKLSRAQLGGLVFSFLVLTVLLLSRLPTLENFTKFSHLVGGANQEEDVPRVVILMSDSRIPVVPDDADEEVPFWTITALSNYAYAQSQGAEFIYYVLTHPASEEQLDSRAACFHRRHGWRAPSWCKLPVAWSAMQDYPSADNFVYIDTDAVFRSPHLPLSLHLDHLTRFRSIGFLSNEWWSSGPCAGYFFFRREAKAFIKAWWDVNLQDKNFDRLWEQDALQHLLDRGIPEGGVSLLSPSYPDRIAFLSHEWQFAEHDPQQLILHASSMEGDHRLPMILSHWNSNVSIDDRQGMKALLEKLSIRMLDASEVAVKMDAETIYSDRI